MSRPPVDEARVCRLAEEGLYLVGEVKEHITREVRLVRYLGGLEEADKLELAEAQADVEDALMRLRVAKGRFEEVGRRFTQKQEIRDRVIEDFALEQRMVEEQARLISKDAKAAGFRYGRPELVGCSATEKETV